MLCRLVLGVQNDSPSWRENIVVCVEFVRLEVKAAEGGRDGERLPVRQMYY